MNFLENGATKQKRSFTVVGEESTLLTVDRFEYSKGNGADFALINANYMGQPTLFDCKLDIISLTANILDPTTSGVTISCGYREMRGGAITPVFDFTINAGEFATGVLVRDVTSSVVIPKGVGITFYTSELVGGDIGGAVLSAYFTEVI